MLTILIIDDDISVLGLIKRMLTKSGYHVESAIDGREGIQKFDRILFDIVITDIVMPYVDGHAVVTHIRRSARHNTPVIGISGTPYAFKQHGYDIVLQKPFSIKILNETIQEFYLKSSKHLSLS